MRIDIDHLTLPEPEAVLLLKDEVRRLEGVIAALADQDATLSVQGGTVIVTMDATLTVEERAVISFASDAYALNDDDHDCWRIANTLRGLLERL